MDGQQYLNQISEANRPVKEVKSKGGIFSSKFFIVGVIGLGLLVLIIIMGAVLGANKGGEENLSYKLKLHLDGTAEVIQEYQPNVKSSELRSSSASLYGVLSNTSKELGSYLKEKYNFEDKNISEAITSKAELNEDELASELFEAKINGILDRIFAHKMAYEITIIMSEESKLYDSTSNETLKGLLDESYKSLENLYDKFNDFSETK
ncbi:MAG: hypothetical protein Q4F56_03050 [Candidatus Saccharibacteria bacterium]|nr:hypothetical protein [Candidatus Saccharibacteria bacterium]